MKYFFSATLLGLCFGAIATLASTPWEPYPAGASFALSGQQHMISADFPIQTEGVRAFQQTGNPLVPLAIEHSTPEDAKYALIVQIPELQRTALYPRPSKREDAHS